MELFGMIGWISVPSYILQYIDLPAESLSELIGNKLLYWWITLGVGGGLFLVGLIFGGIGLLRLSKRAGIRHGWIGFLPFANTYLTGELAGETSVFGAKVKRIGLWAMLAEIVFVAFNVFHVVLQMIVLDPAYYAPVADAEGVYALSQELLPASMQWIYVILRFHIFEIVEYIFGVLIIFVFCMLFFAFYRKYYTRSPFMMTFLSAVLPGRGFAIFAVRNNQPIDYMAFLRRQMERQQPYGGGYGPTGPSAPPEEPFGEEFGAPSSSPGGSAPPSGGPAPSGGSSPSDHDDPFPDF